MLGGVCEEHEAACGTVKGDHYTVQNMNVMIRTDRTE